MPAPSTAGALPLPLPVALRSPLPRRLLRHLPGPRLLLPRRPRPAPPPWALAAAWLAAASAALAVTVPPVTENGPSYQLPTGNGREVYRFGDDGPAPVQDFLAARGRAWRIYWDDALDT